MQHSITHACVTDGHNTLKCLCVCVFIACAAETRVPAEFVPCVLAQREPRYLRLGPSLCDRALSFWGDPGWFYLHIDQRTPPFYSSQGGQAFHGTNWSVQAIVAEVLPQGLSFSLSLFLPSPLLQHPAFYYHLPYRVNNLLV